MGDEGKENKREKLALGVAQGWSVRRSSQRAGVAETTARRWASDPAFQERVASLREDMLSQALGVLQAGAVRAARTLVRLLDAKDSEGSELRLKAARAILLDLVSVREHAQLVADVAELRKHLEPQAEK
jgi:hypothetical protein